MKPTVLKNVHQFDTSSRTAREFFQDLALHVEGNTILDTEAQKKIIEYIQEEVRPKLPAIGRSLRFRNPIFYNRPRIDRSLPSIRSVSQKSDTGGYGSQKADTGGYGPPRDINKAFYYHEDSDAFKNAFPHLDRSKVGNGGYGPPQAVNKAFYDRRDSDSDSSTSDSSTSSKRKSGDKHEEGMKKARAAAPSPPAGYRSPVAVTPSPESSPPNTPVGITQMVVPKPSSSLSSTPSPSLPNTPTPAGPTHTNPPAVSPSRHHSPSPPVADKDELNESESHDDSSSTLDNDPPNKQGKRHSTLPPNNGSTYQTRAGQRRAAAQKSTRDFKRAATSPLRRGKAATQPKPKGKSQRRIQPVTNVPPRRSARLQALRSKPK